MKSITRKQLEKFHKAYHENPMNKVIENAIYNNGIDEVLSYQNLKHMIKSKVVVVGVMRRLI